jgi:hypothetical protein
MLLVSLGDDRLNGSHMPGVTDDSADMAHLWLQASPRSRSRSSPHRYSLSQIYRERQNQREREREMTNTPRICTTVKNRIIAVGLVLHHVGKASMRARVLQEFKFLSLRPQKLSLCNSFAGMWPGRPFLRLQRPSPPPDPFLQGYLRLVFFTIYSPGQRGLPAAAALEAIIIVIRKEAMGTDDTASGRTELSNCLSCLRSRSKPI